MPTTPARHVSGDKGLIELKEHPVTHSGLVEEPQQHTIDTTIVRRARHVMQSLLLDCLHDPLEPSTLRTAAAVQGMLLDDVADAHHRLQVTS